MAKRTSTEELAEEFKSLRVEDDASKKIKVAVQMTVFNPPACLSDPASVEMRTLDVSAPALLDGATTVMEEAAKRQRRFAQVVQNAFGRKDPRVAAQEVMEFAATEVETIAYGVLVPPEEGGAPAVTVTAVPEAFEPDPNETDDEDINGFYGMGTSGHDAFSVDLGEAPRWSYLDRFRTSAPVARVDPTTIDLTFYRCITNSLLKNAIRMGDQRTVDKMLAMGVDPNYEPPVLPSSPCFLVEEQNAVVA